LGRQAGEKAELDERGLVRRFLGELVQGVADQQDLLGPVVRQATRFVEFDPLPVAAVLGPPFPPGGVDEDAAHGLGRGGEEVAAAVPELGLFHVHESEIRLMDQGRGLQRLAGLFLSEPLGREFAELLVDQRQELLGGVRVALFDGGQDAGDLAHRRHQKGECPVGTAPHGGREFWPCGRVEPVNASGPVRSQRGNR
jgi:hypothetical protein